MANVFTTTVGVLGVNPFVRPPDDVLAEVFRAAQKDTSPIPVRGTLNGAAWCL